MARWTAFGKAVFKVGATFTKMAGKTAGKGSVWVVKKAAVDPVARKVVDTKLVKMTSKMNDRRKRSECLNCGKKFNNRNGQYDYCKIACAQDAFTEFSERYEKEMSPRERDPEGWNDLYLACGCNKNGVYHNCGKQDGERMPKKSWW